MFTRPPESIEPRPFAVLDISYQEERIYRWLLAHPRASAPEAADALALSAGRAQRLLDAIEVKGLTAHSPERPRRYIPIGPDIAVDALILQRQNDLQRAQNAAKELRKQIEEVQPRDEQEQVVELITNQETARHIYDQINRTAQHEVLNLIRPPMLISRLNIPSEQDERCQREAQTRGVRYRSIAGTDFMAMTGAMQRVKENIDAGEEVRILSGLPFKMVLVDRRIAFVPLYLQQSGSPSLMVRSSALLDALYALFEIFWDRAAPVSFTRGDKLEMDAPDSRLPKEAEDLILLMTAGLNDKKIAAELGMSLSTLTRRISELMRAFNARSRFQLGCLITRSLANRNER